MKDGQDIMVLFVVGIGVCIAIFLGVTGVLKKSFKSENPFENSEKNKIIAQQQRKIDQVQDDYRRMMEDQKQRIDDYQTFNPGFNLDEINQRQKDMMRDNQQRIKDLQDMRMR